VQHEKLQPKDMKEVLIIYVSTCLSDDISDPSCFITDWPAYIW
jgi:hypothetical protein